MQPRASFVCLLLGACSPDLDLPKSVDISCDTADECPGSLRCAVARRTCVAPELLCSGEASSCRLGQTTGVCHDDLCVGAGCGNGVQEAGEVCDDGNSDSGDLCSADCSSLEVCGNGIRDVDEGCDCGDDTVDLPAGCTQHNADTALAECRSDCKLPHCGDGVRTGLEACDGADLGDASCQDLGFYGDTGLVCSDYCTFDATACTGGRCGDDVRQGVESCDGIDFGGKSCLAFGFHGAPGLTCNDACLIDVGGCAAQGICGDGQKNGAEACDKSDLGGKTCLDFDYYVAEGLACNAACALDTTGCAGICGDGVRDLGEACDCGGAPCTPLQLDEATCQTFGYYDAPGLGCNAACGYVDEACTGYCLDGIKNGTEICDGEWLDPRDCVDFGFDRGPAGCSPFCGPSFDDCGSIGWRTAPSGTTDIEALAASSQTDAWAFGLEPGVRFATDAWFPFPGAPSDIADAVAVSSTNVWAVGGTQIHHWNGAAWSSQAAPAGPLYAITVVGEQIIAVGDAVVTGTDGALSQVLPNPATSTLRDVWAASPTEIHAVGGNGFFVHFDGDDWTPSTHGSSTMYSVFGSGAHDVWAGGSAKTLWHYDGATWSLVSSGGPVNSDIMVLSGSGRRDVWSLRRDGIMGRYDGERWTSYPALESPTNGRASLATGGVDDVFVNLGHPRTWQQRGGSWSSVALPPLTGPYALDLAGASPDDLWLANDEVYHYDGQNWTPQGLAGDGLEHIFVLGKDVWAWGYDYFMHYDGTSWEPLDTGGESLSAGARAVWAWSPSYLWLCDDNGPLRLRDGVAERHDPGVTFNAIWGVSENELWMVGFDGNIGYFDDDLGFTLIESSPTTSSLWAVWGSSAGDVWAVGDLGTILHYNGVDWSVVPSPTTARLLRLFGSGAGDVWAAGESNVLIHYDGVAWTKVRSPTTGLPTLTALTGSPRHLVVLAGNSAFHLDHASPIACADTELSCGDAVDDDCDGAIDEADADCLGGPRLGEIALGAPAYFEVSNRGASTAGLAGLSLAYRFTCSTGVQRFTFDAGAAAPAATPYRAIDTPLVVQRERYLGNSVCAGVTDSGWVALCAGRCDLAGCTNLVDYIELAGGTAMPATPACASMVAGGVDVTGAAAGQSVTRSSFVGARESGVASDWGVMGRSRN